MRRWTEPRPGAEPWPVEQQDRQGAERGRWCVCAHPERPIDGDCYFHDCCRACLVAADAAAARGGTPLNTESGQLIHEALRARLEQYGPAPATANPNPFRPERTTRA